MRKKSGNLSYAPRTNYYMHKLESVILNDPQEIFFDFDIWIDPLILAKRPDLVIVHKQNATTKSKQKTLENWICHTIYCFNPADHRVKIKENENIDKYLDLARELIKL